MDENLSTPARELFPAFALIPDMYAREVEGLDEARLDHRRPEKGWGLWSIREQVSHAASVPYRWLLVRWRPFLYPERPPRAESFIRDAFDARMMNPARYREIGVLLDALRDAHALGWEILGGETLGSLREKGPLTERVPHGTLRSPGGEDIRAWRENVNLKAHPDGIWISPDDPDLFCFNLEYTFRHLLWEGYAHLYTIQMHKKAEGLPPVVQIPREGYLNVLSWD